MKGACLELGQWRSDHPGETLTYDILCEVLGLPHLAGADLRHMRLYGVDFSGRDLSGVDMSHALAAEANFEGSVLEGANLSGMGAWGANFEFTDLDEADLTGAYLGSATLSGTQLHLANLTGVRFYRTRFVGTNDWGGLPIHAGRSGEGAMIPTPGGWRISIGCWKNRTLDDLRDLVEDRAIWPEARGSEREFRRPRMRAVLALCEAHAAEHAGLIESLADKWGEPKERRRHRQIKQTQH